MSLKIELYKIWSLVAFHNLDKIVHDLGSSNNFFGSTFNNIFLSYFIHCLLQIHSAWSFLNSYIFAGEYMKELFQTM